MNVSWRRLRFPSPALVVSSVALFAAMGGGAYAATSLSHTGLTWHTATMQHGWGVYSTGYANAGYSVAGGVVHLRGAISGGPSNSLAFRLPPGYRPGHFLFLPIYTFGGSVGSVEITPQGYVTPFGTSAGSYAGLDGINFAAGE